MISSKLLTLLVCSKNKERLSVFIRKNKKILEEVACLFVVDFLPSSLDVQKSHKFLQVSNSSLSKKRNKGIDRINSRYVAMLDDDCIPNKDWVEQVLVEIKKGIDISFGNVFPYTIGKTERNSECLVVIEKQQSEFIDKENFVDHFKQIGFTNNCLIKTHLLKNDAYFKEWLGPGTFLKTGEDAELILELIAAGHAIFHNSKKIIFHNSWIQTKEIPNRRREYILGGTVAYIYHVLKGEWYCFPYVSGEISRIFENIKVALARYFSDFNGNELLSIFYDLKLLCLIIVSSILVSLKVLFQSGRNN